MRTAARLFPAIAGTVAVIALAGPSPAAPPSVADIFARPLISRAYEQRRWTLPGGGGSPAQTPATVGAALAALRPTYVSGLVYLRNDTVVTDAMVRDFDTIRAAVRKRTPDARFDIEFSLNPRPLGGRPPFADAAALVAKIAQVDARFHPDGWWFDFYSTAQKMHPDWIAAAVRYAHAHEQTIGGNVFNDVVPPGSDAIAFVDKPMPGSRFGFDFRRDQIARLRAGLGSTVLLGHLQSNPQNGPTTESCTYANRWSPAQRADYLRYWGSQQAALGFRFMWPAFYPLCPGARAFDPSPTRGADGRTLLDEVGRLLDPPPAR